jgi:large subunit ribosomal protein L11
MSSVKASGKAVVGLIKLQIPAGKATPSPPVGPALGQKGLNIMEFCKAFNDRTKTLTPGTPVGVLITAYGDRTFTFILKGSPVTHYIKQEIGCEKGSSTPGRTSIGTITWQQIENVAKKKMQEGLSARDLENAKSIVAGSARSMGLKIIGERNG